MFKKYQFRVASRDIARRFAVVKEEASGLSVDEVMSQVFSNIGVCDRNGFGKIARAEFENRLSDGEQHQVEFMMHEAIPGKRPAVMLPVGTMQLVRGS